jgi:hypothetical protein
MARKCGQNLNNELYRLANLKQKHSRKDVDLYMRMLVKLIFHGEEENEKKIYLKVHAAIYQITKYIMMNQREEDFILKL